MKFSDSRLDEVRVRVEIRAIKRNKERVGKSKTLTLIDTTVTEVYDLICDTVKKSG